MPRYARPHVTGGLFHVISRFHNREYLLDKPGSRERYLLAIGKAAERFDTRILAYCLMSSHVHLVLQLGKDPLGPFMKSVNTGWANWLNKKFNRIGTTLAGRPRSVFCDTQTYALELVRYVHNNPVRAGVVKQASGSSWSSHRFYLNENIENPPWLDIAPVLKRFSGEREEASRLFDAWVNEEQGGERRPELSGEIDRNISKHIRSLLNGPVEVSYPILGPDNFIVEAFGKQEERNEDLRHSRRSKLGALDVLISACQECGVKQKDALGRTRVRKITRVRRLTAWIWCERFSRPQSDIVALFSLAPTSVSEMIGAMRKDGREEEERETIERIVKNIQEKMLLESSEKKEALSSRDPERAQHILLERLRDVGENLKTVERPR